MSNMFYYSDSEEATEQKLISKLISAELSPEPTEYWGNITFSMEHGNYTRDKIYCAFVKEAGVVSDAPFSRHGCSKVTSRSSGTRTECTCNHTTSFAVMTKIDGKKIPVSTFY